MTVARSAQAKRVISAKKQLVKAIADRFNLKDFGFWDENPDTEAVRLIAEFGSGMRGIILIVERDGEVICPKYWDDRLSLIDTQWVIMRTGEPCELVNGWPARSVMRVYQERIESSSCPWCGSELDLKCSIVDSRSIWHLDCSACRWTKRCDGSWRSLV